MKIAAISCVKDEDDIIETFIRVNSSFVDTFIFINDSIDGTNQILNKMIEEDFDIIVLYRDRSKPYKQPELVQQSINYAILNHLNIDIYLPLDCDEFPQIPDKLTAETIFSEIPSGSLGFYNWISYIPIALNFTEKTINALTDCFKQREAEPVAYSKIIIPADLATNILLAPGSHAAINLNGQPLPKFHVQAELGHFPVRSPSQIMKKNIAAVYGLLRRSERHDSEGYHVFEVINQMAKSGFNLNLEELQKIAMTYCNDYKNNAHIALGANPGWIKNYELKYSKLSSENNDKLYCQIIYDSWINTVNMSIVTEMKNRNLNSNS